MIRSIILLTALIGLFAASLCAKEAKQPNIILMMADDLGYGDTGFNGNTVIKTPNLDQMAHDGAVMSNFHSSSPVCSPTRGSVLTGRHPFRYGIFGANQGHLPKEELTIPEILKSEGYATGHFGKWHLGTLSPDFSPKGPKRKPKENFSPPAWHGYDVSFVTESAVATWDPSYGGRAKDNPFWLNGKALDPDDSRLKGGAGRVVMDQALEFIDQSVESGKPFFIIVWFHAPHAPVVAGPEYLAMYPDEGEAAHYYGSITEMDDQVGRLREHLAKLNVSDNTFISFTSDNGPEGKKIKGRKAGKAGGLRGRKRSLYEGGVRVPTLMLHPGKIKAKQVIDTASTTMDYLPTVLDITGIDYPSDRPVDGHTLKDVLFEGKSRQANIPFYHRANIGLIKGDYKLLIGNHGEANPELYHQKDDFAEATNLAKLKPEIVSTMKKQLMEFKQSAKESHKGLDYENEATFSSVDPWPSEVEKSGKKQKKSKSKDKDKKKKGKKSKESHAE